jgi:hypothetical protein
MHTASPQHSLSHSLSLANRQLSRDEEIVSLAELMSLFVFAHSDLVEMGLKCFDANFGGGKSQASSGSGIKRSLARSTEQIIPDELLVLL